MLYPDFCEAQLQAVCNIAICRLLGGTVYPTVPSLAEEHYLGWDTGLVVGRDPVPAPDQKGCNFFIQYKLAYVVEGPRGKQYIYWKKSYYRFEIPHIRRGRNGYYEDYSQYYKLRALRSRGYPVVYISNAVIEVRRLVAEANRNIDRVIAVIDVEDIKGPHRFVTYTEQSPYVLLHSEPVNTIRYSIELLRGLVRDAPSTAFEEDLTAIPDLLGRDDEFLGQYLAPSSDLSIVQNWLRMAWGIYMFTGIRMYKWLG